MEIQQLRHLIAAVETRNLLRAADKAFISQSGLSRSLKSLEERLGVPLLVRGPKGVEPTIYGQTILRRARVILNEVARSIEEVRAIEQGRIGEITLGVTQNYGHYLIPHLIAELTREQPGIQITIVTDGFLELTKLVKTEEIDFAFGLIGQIHRSDGLIVEPLMAHRSSVIVRRNHPLANRQVSIDDLANAQWAMLSSESVQRGFGLFFESRDKMVPLQLLKCNSIALIRRVVAETDSLTILPQDAVQADIDNGALAVLECDTPVERTRVGLVFREGGLMTPQAEMVADRIRCRIAENTQPHASLGIPLRAAVGH